MSERQHHPACPARHGGLCTQCPTVVKDAAGHEPDIRCAICNETYIIAAESISARRAALASWPGCCTPNTRAPAGGRCAGQTPAGDVGEAPSSAGSTHPDDLPATYKRRRKVRPGKSRPSLLSGVPAFVTRRWAVGR